LTLKDKRVFVTGGSRGLGRELCCAFAEEGARVAFNYSSDDDGANATIEAVREFGIEARPLKCSVLDQPSLAQSVRELEDDWGGIDALVNNAGISQMLPMALMEEEDWDAVMDVNVKGTFLVTKAVLRGMIRRKSGTILNIGSLAGVRLIEAPVHYASSKAALKGFTESLAKEVGRYGITVNCLAPGILEGGVGNQLPAYRLEDYVHHCALGRIGTFRDVANTAAFMISDENSYMTGATLVMDGGL
jgi:3-oxoacyl-[acyl-carrier protein] reductase